MDTLKPNIQATSNTGRVESTLTGIKLASPYVVGNMQQALDDVWTSSDFKESPFATSLKTQFIIKASHYYVKFAPKSVVEEALLKSDDSLILFDYPLDYEFTDEELDNREGSINGIPEYYTTVSVDKVMPENVSYQILEEVYFPEDDPYFDDITEIEENLESQRGVVNTKQDFLRNLLYEAYAKLGNAEELVGTSNNTTKWIFGKKWYPSGRITIKDDVITHVTGGSSGFTEYGIPVQGAKIVIRQGFRVAKTLTNDNGTFQTGRVRGKARYIIKWERKDWSIRSGTFGQAETRGPTVLDKPWIRNLYGGKPEYYGQIHRALDMYFYKSIGGIKRPPTYSQLLAGQIKISAMFTDDGPNNNWHYVNFIPLQPISTIRINRFGANSDAVFGTTLHELAHSTNSYAGAYNFLSAESRLRETYANTIEWYLASIFYNTWGITSDFTVLAPDNTIATLNNPYVYERNYQVRSLNVALNNVYTSLMVDLIDDENQSVTRAAFGIPLPIDRVSGYTIIQIENEVMNSRTFESLRINLNKYPNPTSGNLDELFANW